MAADCGFVCRLEDMGNRTEKTNRTNASTGEEREVRSTLGAKKEVGELSPQPRTQSEIEVLARSGAKCFRELLSLGGARPYPFLAEGDLFFGFGFFKGDGELFGAGG
jgi:hypothetical protein